MNYDKIENNHYLIMDKLFCQKSVCPHNLLRLFKTILIFHIYNTCKTQQSTTKGREEGIFCTL